MGKKTPMGFCSNKQYQKRFKNKKKKKGKDRGAKKRGIPKTDLSLFCTTFPLEYEYTGL